MSRDMQIGEWLRGSGADADIAVCTRVRLARNVDGFRFSTVMSSEESLELAEFIEHQFADLDLGGPARFVNLGELDPIERSVLVERHLISRELAASDRARGLLLDDPESVSIMVNEEDHLRSQVFRSGFELESTYERAIQLDREMGQRVPMAFSEEFGFLTSCPTNTGTGMRLSVMLHLPGLVWADEIEKATGTAQKIHLAVRGLYGEGSRSLGDFYQVSNQVTLGRSETQILADVQRAVARLVEWEREVRGALLKGTREVSTLDRIFRALGSLEHARILSSEEALNCLSAVRLGAEQGILEGPSTDRIHRAILLCQPAHLQRVRGTELDPTERDQHRANLVRELLFGE